MIKIGKQEILQIKDLPRSTFFVIPPYAGARPDDPRFNRWHVLIGDEDLPRHMRLGTETDACFRISEFQPRNGQPVLVWVRETAMFDDDDCVAVVSVDKLTKNGADICVLAEHERRPEMPPAPAFSIPATRKPRGGRGRTRGSHRTH